MLLNMAAVELALKDYGAAAEQCNQVLVLEPGNVAAHLRRAKARIARREFKVRT